MQSVQYGTATGIGWGVAAAMLARERDPLTAHTFFPPSWPREVTCLTGESLSTSTSWPESRYTLEKSITLSRAQVITKSCATLAGGGQQCGPHQPGRLAQVGSAERIAKPVVGPCDLDQARVNGEIVDEPGQRADGR